MISSNNVVNAQQNRPIVLMPHKLFPNHLTQPSVTYTSEPQASKKKVDPIFYVVDGQMYDQKGYKICGYLNQHNTPCQRLGRCPFHDKKPRPKNPTYPPNIITKKSKSEIKKQPYKRGWTKDEHFRFLTGLKIHGRGSWKEISKIVKTRTPIQIQSHAQKYFRRQKQKTKKKRSIHDYTIDDLKNVSSDKLLEQTKQTTMINPFVKSPNPPLDMSSFVQFFQPNMSHQANHHMVKAPPPLHPFQSTQPIFPMNHHHHHHASNGNNNGAMYSNGQGNNHQDNKFQVNMELVQQVIRNSGVMENMSNPAPLLTTSANENPANQILGKRDRQQMEGHIDFGIIQEVKKVEPVMKKAKI